METFIQLTARDLLSRFGTNLRDVTVIFPNKRAGLFMNQQLAALSDKPVWAPRYRTISELFDLLSDFTRCDDILAVCELYSAYATHVADAEPLDRFYSWGEVMLADFDDIDKHLVNAHNLFSNIKAIKEIERDNFLTPKQEEALQQFFEGFSVEGNSKLKEKFLALWNRMDEIYASFHQRLKELGMLYEGAMYRDVVEHLDEREERIPIRMTYVFVGFNVLNDVEKALFRFLQQRGQALFYWDYDVLYTEKDSLFEAGTFIRENLKEFPNALPESCFDNLRNPPHMEFVAATSGNAQARYVSQWLETELTEPEKDTAVVLCDESLLQPVLHALPDASSPHPVKRANITMGFPLTDTPIFSFVNALLSLQTDGYDRERHQFRPEQEDTARRHPYTAMLDEKTVFCPHADNHEMLLYIRSLLEDLAVVMNAEHVASQEANVFGQLYSEALFRTHQIVGRFVKLIEDEVLQVEPSTLRRLLRTVLGSATIPFHGEPAVGLQVMGLLETRNLNFKHILMLSVNEGMLPKSTSATSFIPYHLREVFGLTTPRHKTAVFAFYFYRLLQRTERITLTFNTATDSINKNEMSRFLRQLLAETDIPIETKILQAEQAVPERATIEVPKTQAIIDKLCRKFGTGVNGSRPLSPSALNNFIDCPLRFYFQQVAGLSKPKDIQNGIDGALFGTLFHDAAELVYHKLAERGPAILKSDIDRLLAGGDAALAPFIEVSFLKNVFDGDEEKVFYNGQLIVIRKFLTSYLRQLLKYDSCMGRIVLMETEQAHSVSIGVNSGGRRLKIDVGGRIDRMDTVPMRDEITGIETETLRVVDYKTGGYPKRASSMEQLVTPSDNRSSYIFQIFLYAYVMSAKQKRPVSPSLFYVHKSNTEDYDPTVVFDGEKVVNFNLIRKDFGEVLQMVLDDLFNPDIPFRQTDNNNMCKYCDFKPLCNR